VSQSFQSSMLRRYPDLDPPGRSEHCGPLSMGARRLSMRPSRTPVTTAAGRLPIAPP
jgi:hypothetical protein